MALVEVILLANIAVFTFLIIIMIYTFPLLKGLLFSKGMDITVNITM